MLRIEQLDNDYVRVAMSTGNIDDIYVIHASAMGSLSTELYTSHIRRLSLIEIYDQLNDPDNCIFVRVLAHD